MYIVDIMDIFDELICWFGSSWCVLFHVHLELFNQSSKVWTLLCYWHEHVLYANGWSWIEWALMNNLITDKQKYTLRNLSSISIWYDNIPRDLLYYVLLNTSCGGLVEGVCGSVAIKHQHSNSDRLEILNVESAKIQHYQTICHGISQSTLHVL